MIRLVMIVEFTQELTCHNDCKHTFYLLTWRLSGVCYGPKYPSNTLQHMDLCNNRKQQELPATV